MLGQLKQNYLDGKYLTHRLSTKSEHSNTLLVVRSLLKEFELLNHSVLAKKVGQKVSDPQHV